MVFLVVPLVGVFVVRGGAVGSSVVLQVPPFPDYRVRHIDSHIMQLVTGGVHLPGV